MPRPYPDAYGVPPPAPPKDGHGAVIQANRQALPIVRDLFVEFGEIHVPRDDTDVRHAVVETGREDATIGQGKPEGGYPAVRYRMTVRNRPGHARADGWPRPESRGFHPWD